MPQLFRRTDVRVGSSLSLTARWSAGLLGSVSQGLVRFLYSVLIGRFLGAAALGTVNAAISTALLLSLLWPTSAGQAATRFVAQLRGSGQADTAQAAAGYLGRRMLGAACVLALAAVGVCLGPLQTDPWTAIGAGLLLLGYAGWSFTRGVQYGAGQIARAAGWDAAGAAVALVLLAAVLALGWQPVLLLPLAIGYGAYAAVCWPRGSGAAIDPVLRAQMNRFVGYGVLGTVSSTGLLQLSMIVSGIAGSDVDTGRYAAALSLATPATMLARTLSQVLFPVLAEAGGRGDVAGLRRQTDAMTRGLAVTMLPVFGALALAADAVLVVAYGTAYVPARLLLQVLLLAVLFTTLPIAAINRLNAVGVAGARFVSTVAAGGLVLAVLAWLLLVPALGVLGVAVGYLAATAAVCVTLLARVWRLDRQRWAGLTARLVAGVAVLVGGLIAVHAAVGSAGPVASAAVGVGAAVVFAGAWTLMCHGDIRRLRRLRRTRAGVRPR